MRTLQKAISLFARANSLLGKCGLVIFIASLVLFSGRAFARTAACTCSPCTCSPCTCGSGGSKGGGSKNGSGKTESKHHEGGRERERDHGHGGVGVGVNVDLGGVGQRKAEPNPFAATNESPPPTHTQEKVKTKKVDKTGDTTFEKVELTTEKAKDLEKPDEYAGTPPGPINVSDEKGATTPAPPPQTQEKGPPLKKESAGFPDQPKPPLDGKTQNKAEKTRNPEEQAILDREYLKASNKLAAARAEWNRGLRVFDPEIARMEDDLDRLREEDPGTGEDDAPAEAEKEQFYESYLNRMAAAEKAWPKTPEGKAAADRVREAKKECERLGR